MVTAGELTNAEIPREDRSFAGLPEVGRGLCAQGGGGPRPDVVAENQASQTRQQPQRRRGKQSLFLEEAVEQHDDCAK